MRTSTKRASNKDWKHEEEGRGGGGEISEGRRKKKAFIWVRAPD